MQNELFRIAKSILDRGFLMSLGTQDSGGIWVSDIVYVNDNGLNLYWISEEASRHSTAILYNKEVAATITITDAPGQPLEGLQISGQAYKIEGEVGPITAKYADKQKMQAPSGRDGILAPGQSWYYLKPSKVEIIYEKLFGTAKQSFGT